MGILPIYTTRAAAEEVGVPLAGWSASRFNRLLLTVGNFLDRITQQRFIAYGETVKLSGTERQVIERPDRLPILSVSNIEVDWMYTNRSGRVFSGLIRDVAIPQPDLIEGVPWNFGGTYAFPTGNYRLKPFSLPRYIESIRGVFPGGANNIAVTGVFGWPELSSIKPSAFSATTTTQISPGSTAVTLSSVTDLRLRDVLIIAGYPFIVKAITGTTVSIDDPSGIITSPLPVGSTAVSYAAVPYDIERVVHFLMVREIARQQSWAAGNFQDPTLIQEEQTDKYSYKMFSPANTIGFGKAPGLTAVPEIDEIITSYTAPPGVEFA